MAAYQDVENEQKLTSLSENISYGKTTIFASLRPTEDEKKLLPLKELVSSQHSIPVHENVSYAKTTIVGLMRPKGDENKSSPVEELVSIKNSIPVHENVSYGKTSILDSSLKSTEDENKTAKELETSQTLIPVNENVSYGKTSILGSPRPMEEEYRSIPLIEQAALQEEQALDAAGKTSKSRRIGAALIAWELFLVFLVLLSLAGAVWAVLVNVRYQAQNSETQQTIEDQLDTLNSSSSSLPPTFEIPHATDVAGDTLIPTGTATPTSSLVDQDVSITLNNVSLFMDCNTTIERTCTIPTDQPQCITAFGTTYQRPGEFIMDISCVRFTPATMSDRNGLSWVLSIDSTTNEVQCLCYVVTLVGVTTGPRRVETCGLRVTRCRTFSTITSTATLTSSP